MRVHVVLSLFLFGSVPATAAPPVLTYLYPAGATRGTTLDVTAGGTFARWPVQGWTSDRGVSLEPLAEKGKFRVRVAAEATPGVCQVRLHDAEGASVLKSFVVGVLPEVVEQEPNNDAKKPQVVEPGVVVNGRLGQPGDVDCFGVRLRKGQTLVADVEAHSVLGSPMDGILQGLSADGSVLRENNDDRGLDPRVVLVAPADGLYVVRLFAFPAEPDSSIRFAGAETYVYRLTLTAGAFADHVFPLAVPRQNPGEVRPWGWNLPEALRLPVKAGEEDAVVFDPRLVRPLKVRIEPHACAVEKEPNDRKKPQTLASPVTVSGKIEPAGDVDVYRVEAKKGQGLLFEVESHALGFPLDPVLKLTDAAGKVLLEQDDAGNGRDATLAYTPSADGVLHVEVSDLHGSGGPRQAYRLRVAPPRPAFALTLKADRFMVAPGKVLEVPVTIERRNGHKDEVELEAIELPAGVTAERVKTTGGSAILKVSAKADAKPGGFRVVGRVAGAAPRYSGHLWLGVSRN